MKKTLWILAILVVTALLVMGCGNANDEESTSEPANQDSNSGGQQEQTEEEPVTLRFSFPGSSDAEKQWVSDFEDYVAENYSHVDIEWIHIPGGDLLQRITVMVQSGDVPDLIGAQDISDFVAMDALLPLNERLEEDNEINREDFHEGALEFSIIDGNIYTLPIVAVPYGLMVNTAVLSEAGFELEDLQNWDDMLLAAEAMTDGENYAYGFTGSNARFHFRDFYIAAASNGIMYDDLTNPGIKDNFIELMNFYLDMKPYIHPAATSVEWGDVHRYMIDKRIGFLGTGSYFSAYMGSFEDNAIENLSVIPFPTGPSVNQTQSLIGNLGFGIFKESENHDLAWEIMKDALSEPFAAQLAGSINVPATTTISEDVLQAEVKKYYSDNLEAQMDILDRWDRIMSDGGVGQPKITGQTEIERAYGEYFMDMYSGDITPEEMYELFIEEVKSIQ